MGDQPEERTVKRMKAVAQLRKTLRQAAKEIDDFEERGNDVDKSECEGKKGSPIGLGLTLVLDE